MSTIPESLVDIAKQGDTHELDSALAGLLHTETDPEMATWLQMMDARVALSRYFTNVRENFSVLEGYVPEGYEMNTNKEFANLVTQIEEFAGEVEEGFDVTAQYVEALAGQRPYAETKLHHSLLAGDLTAKRVMRLIITGNYHGLDTAGRVVGASGPQVLALLKHIQTINDIAQGEQGSDAALRDERDEAGQAIREAFEAGQRVINYAMDGLLPDEPKAEEDRDDN